MKKIIFFLVLALLLPFTSSTEHYVRTKPLVRYNTVQAEVTAYTASPDETDSNPNVTASGARAVKGVIACPRHLPFGTKVEINGKHYSCQDRMNARYKGNYFDVLVATKAEAFEWGRKIINIKIYN